MHIIAIIASVIGGLLFVLWRMQQAANATRDIADAASEVQGLFRRWKWSRKANANPLDMIEDPREAAAAMMVAVAQNDGPLTDAERTLIISKMTETFDSSPKQAEELLARGRWLTKDSLDIANVMRRVAPVILKSCGPNERRDLLAMLLAAATVHGPLDPTIQQDIKRFAQQLQV